MLYQIYDDNQAISLLKDNYDFIYFYDQNVESAINNFIDYVNSIIHNESICKQLKKILKNLLLNDHAQEIQNRLIRHLENMFLINQRIAFT